MATTVDNIINMQAERGRTSYFSARNVGYQGPGATPSWLIIKAMQEGLVG